MDSPATENAEKPLAVPRTAHKESAAAVWLDRAIIFWLVLFAVSAPHSIAATQICWASAMLFWAARLLFRPRPVWPRTPVDYALLCFVILTVISSLFSYDQAASLPRLRTVSLFTIAYVVAGNVRGSRIFRLLALILIASCMVNVFYTLGARVVGRGVRIEGVAPNSPLSAALFVKEDKTEDPTPILSGDTLLEVDGVRLSSPEQLAAALETSNAGDYALVKIYRVEWTPVLKV
ncbi:MAG TPA: PDZ domain-containing protein, partial [Pyrinomonadaceae bacterium]|nr:PDZ domain-containing protein [Pyrinomonadaceae bacterium]